MLRAQRLLPLGLAGMLFLGASAEEDVSPTSAGEQEPTPVYLQLLNTVEVSLAEVDVVVTDRKGRVIEGLGPGDFELLEEGEPVEIQHFSAYDPEGARAPTEGLLVVVYVDRSFLKPGELQRTLRDLAPLLESKLPEGARVMLVSAGQGLEILELPTEDGAVVSAKLAALGSVPGRGSQLAAEYDQLAGGIDRTLQEGANSAFAEPSELSGALLSQINTFATEVQGEVRRSAGQLYQLIDILSGIAGRKEVLYIGGGLPVDAGQSLIELWQTAFGEGSRWRQNSGEGSRAADVADSAVERGGRELLAPVMRRATVQRVSFHTLEAGGLRAPVSFTAADTVGSASELGGGALPAQVSRARGFGDSESLRELAAATGGRSLVAGHRLDRALEGLIDDWTRFYTLAFAIPEVGTEPRRLEVRLKEREGLKTRRLEVRHRRFYQPKDRDQQAAERTISALLAQAEDNALEVEITLQEREETPAEAAAGSRRGGDRDQHLEIRIRVPLASLALVADGRSHLGQVSVFLTSGDLKRGVAPVQKATLPLRIENHELLTALGRTLEYRLPVDLAPGVGRVAVSVRDDYAPVTSTLVVTRDELPAPARA